MENKKRDFSQVLAIQQSFDDAPKIGEIVSYISPRLTPEQFGRWYAGINIGKAGN